MSSPRPVHVVPKPFWKSKTLWANAVALLTFLGAQPYIADNPTATAIVGAVIAIANIGLRTVTDAPVTVG